jgi:hypothetical protein
MPLERQDYEGRRIHRGSDILKLESFCAPRVHEDCILAFAMHSLSKTDVSLWRHWMTARIKGQ